LAFADKSYDGRNVTAVTGRQQSGSTSTSHFSKYAHTA